MSRSENTPTVPGRGGSSLRPVSPTSSLTSEKSDRSKGHVPDFSDKTKRPVSPAASLMSEKSDRSKGHVPDFNNDLNSSFRPVSPASMKSDRSKGHVPDFSGRPVSPASRLMSEKSDRLKGHFPDFRNEPRPVSPSSSLKSENGDQSNIHSSDFRNEPQESTQQDLTKTDVATGSSRKAPNNQEKLASKLKERFLGIQYTTDKWKKNSEHVIIAAAPEGGRSKTLTSVSKIFEPEETKTIRTVMTIGEKGMGKSVLVQELLQDWSKKDSIFRWFKNLITTKNEDVIFPVKLSKLSNLTKEVSLVGLLNILFVETTECVISDYNKPNIVFILDGLHELVKLPLDFDNSVSLTDVNEPASVEVILINLIKGTLLPSAWVWITSTSSAAGQIPDKFIHRKTMIRVKDAKDELSKQRRTQLFERYKDVEKEEADSQLNVIQPSGQHYVKNISDIFTHSKKRAVLTKGIAGIGKTFQTKKFMFGWGQKKLNTNIDLVLSFDFDKLRQVNSQSFEGLLNKYFNVPQGCYYYKEYEIVIILDGLEKCTLPLDFENNKKLKDIKVQESMDVLITNLINGNLLPSARIWILTQPSGVDKIPSHYIDMVTECQETSKRWERLVKQMKTSLKANFEEDLNHPNQKNTEHIVRADGVKKKSMNTISDLFNEEQIRTVMTIGESQIGKSYLVQKLTDAWTKPESSSFFQIRFWKNKNPFVLFPLKCSKLFMENTFSLVGHLNILFEKTKNCVISDYNKVNIVFILDGLHELVKLPLDFDNSVSLADVNEPASVEVILINLIKGTLLPSARVWITSRPSVAGQIPDTFIHMKTEIREKPDVASQRNLRNKLRDQFNRVAEGVDRDKASSFLKDIYTDLYIIEGERGEVNQQHETKLVQEAKNIEVRKEIPINYKDIFKSSCDTPNTNIKTVLTTGVAGIGKTFASMKYMLDWAEGSATEGVYFTFPFPFRELNLRKDTECSLEDLIHQFFPLMKTSEITNYDQYKIMIVLDGLDECRLDLSFEQSLRLSDVKEKSSVRNLLMNLIEGNLLPKAQIWITSRPAASLCIPAITVDRVTEVRGFNDEQKEEYFRKKFTDAALAEKILDHVKQSRSIYIMCHIPVFCWIVAKVLEDFEQREDDPRMPKTLTDLYIYFLLLQCRQASVKFGEVKTEERNMKTVLALGKLAFQELEKGNLLFTEDDLSRYGLDVQDAAVFSGLLTQIIRDDCDAYQKRFFCFVHMSIQEFLGALYAFHTFRNEGTNVLTGSASEEQSESDFYKTAIDKALESKNGKWDLFLRFLLGLSLENNQLLLQTLLKKSENTEKTNKETIAYIKAKIDEDSSDADNNMNLFHCLNELNDLSLVEEVKKYLSAEATDFENFSHSKWSALSFVLLTSDEKLDVFDLKMYVKSEKVLQGMLPVVKVSKKALLSWCGLSALSCSGLSSFVLTSSSSNLTELDLSHNDLMDSGVQKLSEGLENLHCKVEILKLAGCQITVEGCSFLATAVKFNKSSPLKDINLSYNHPGEDGMKMLTDLVEDPNIKLKKVCFEHSGKQRLQPGLRKYSADLVFDADTAHQRLVLCEEKQQAKTWENVDDRVFHTQDDKSCMKSKTFWCKDVEKRCRCSQVFCEQELRGPWYWEVEWDGTVGIGVSYKGASNKNVMGFDEKSWCVFCTNRSKNSLDFEEKNGQQRQNGKGAVRIIKMHRKKFKMLSKTPKKMAVFLDWEGGTLTYYDVTSGELKEIHTFRGTFKEPLVPGFWFKCGSVRLCEIV